MKTRTVQLGKILEIEKGKKAERLLDHPSRTSRRYLQIEDLRPDAKPKFVEPFACPLAAATDVIIAWDGANAGTVSCNLAGYIGSTLAILRPDPEFVHPPYLSRFLECEFDYLQVSATGATIPHIGKDALESLQLPLPSLPDQRRIAAMLEQADRLRRTRRYALELSDTFLPAAFLDMFADRFREGLFDRFGELVTITGGGTPSRDCPEFFRGRIPWLTSKDMRGDYIWDTEEHITEAAIEGSATNLVPVNSILVVVKSKILMHRLPVVIACVPMCHGQDIKSIQCSSAIHYEFARFVLKHHEGRLLLIARGANTEGLTLPMLDELPVPKISFSEQQRFADLVRGHERLRSAQRESLRLADHLFQSLLHQAFAEEN